MKDFKDSYDFIKHLINRNGPLRFYLDSTPYGTEFYWHSDIDEKEKLEGVLLIFDDDYHDENGLERGTSREYVIKIENDELIGEVKYTWDYSNVESTLDDWDDLDLVELIKNEISAVLSNKMGVPKDEFSKKYYYRIEFSSELNEEEEEFLLFDWENDEEVKIPPSFWIELKESIIRLSLKNGVNTSESVCSFNFQLNHETHYISENWYGEVTFEKLINDDETYEFDV